ncbi:MAG TPA: hypothetical protein VF054_01115 [Micromonosporaceae bacterium]
MSSVMRGRTVTGPVSGWLTFAGILAVLVGAFNTVDGLVALVRHRYFVVNGDQLLLMNLTGWGWFLLVLGVVQVVVGLGVLAGVDAARWGGVALASLAALVQLLFLAAAPFWSLIVIGLCVLVIYALVVPPRGATG